MKKTTTIDALPASIEEEKCSPVSDTAVEEEKVDALSASIEENKCSPVGGNDARTMNVENIDALSASIEENKCSPVGGNDARTMNVENIDALSASNIENECSPVNGPVAYLDHPEPAANLDEPAENATKPAADNAKPAADNAKPAEPAEPAEPSEYAEYAEYAEPTAYAEPAEYAEYAEPTALAAFAQPTTFAESAIQPQPRPAETNIANSDNYEAYEPRELQTSSSCYSDGQSSSHSLEDRILRRLRESMSPFAIEVEEEEGNADLLSICSNNSDEPQHQYSALGRETPKLVIPKKRGAPTCKADKHGAAISKSPKEPEAVKPNEIVPPIATAVETTRHKEPEAEKPNNVDSSEANRKMERAPSVDSAVDDKKTKKSIARRIVELVQSLVACFRAKPKADPTPPIIAPVRIRTPMTYARVAANYGVWPDHSRVFVLGA
ncbi:uncharacterized protein LODBEIA_P40630 [Lodderomyces beijingensis]|uniref:Uncharacterized protein n=1 Tax=Lodderomyces beijingensis TaxID=1775926 RepID=A0ABP0ZNW3_9ASCO